VCVCVRVRVPVCMFVWVCVTQTARERGHAKKREQIAKKILALFLKSRESGQMGKISVSLFFWSEKQDKTESGRKTEPRERASVCARQRVCIYVCVCVRERGREEKSVSMCVCEEEREGREGRERGKGEREGRNVE